MAVERTLNILRAAAIAAGAGQMVLRGYRELKRPDSPLRAVVLDRVADRIGFTDIKDDPSAVDKFLFEIPGRLRSAAIAADVLAQPEHPWNSTNLLRDSLSAREATAFCIEAKPADPDKLFGLYIVKEHGDPIEKFNFPGIDGPTDIATVRYFIAGRRHIPASLSAQVDRRLQGEHSL